MKDTKWVRAMWDLGIDITPLPDGNYDLHNYVSYYSKRYALTVLAEPGIYDGATGAIDIASKSWIIHDQICNEPFAIDGRPITSWMAAMILHDILKEEKHGVRSRTWRAATFLLGCKKARSNGWF